MSGSGGMSGGGMSGIAFSTNVPHTVRGRDGTKQCSDCHVSVRNDNNAWMAQLLMHGTNYLNFVGRYAWVACGEHGLVAPVVTERDEPQAVIGSTLHELAFPEHFHKHVEDGKKLALVNEGMSLQQLVDGLNALGIGPRDMIAILQAIKAAGAIQADIEVM